MAVTFITCIVDWWVYGQAKSDLHFLSILTSYPILFFSAGVVFLRLAVLKYVCFSNTGLIYGSAVYFVLLHVCKFLFSVSKCYFRLDST